MHFMMRQHLAEIQCYMLADEVGVVLRDLRVWVVESDRGWCHQPGLIEIPTWVFDKSDDYRTYYIAHELAHWIVGVEHQHDLTFQSVFKLICPPWCQQYEEGYKLLREQRGEQ